MPFETEVIPISDDEDDHGALQQAVSKELVELEKKIKEANETVLDFCLDVESYRDLLRAAEDRLQRSRDRKKKLVAEKNSLVERKQKLLQRKRIKLESQVRRAQSPVIASASAPAAAAAAAAEGQVDKAIKGAAPGSFESRFNAVEPRSTQSEPRTSQSTENLTPTLKGRTATASDSIESRYKPGEPQSTKTRAEENQTPEGRASEGHIVNTKFSFPRLRVPERQTVTYTDNSRGVGAPESQTATNPSNTRGVGLQLNPRARGFILPTTKLLVVTLNVPPQSPI